jgi:FMN phosphatase YigB (HAD superfamily)
MPQKVIAVDLDKTLAKHRDGQLAIGRPLAPMVKVVREHLSKGDKVVVFTARLSRATTTKAERAKIHREIALWTKKHVGKSLTSTAEKQPWFHKLYDDRAVSVTPNRGTIRT